MRKLLLMATLVLLVNFTSKACLNGEHLLLNSGEVLFIDEEEMVPFGHAFPSQEDLLEMLEEQDSLYETTGDLGYLSDKGLLLILLKRYDEAIKLYLDIEARTPRRYSTASNLGTAYELTGQNEKALFWIKRSVEIDSASHYESEWIHVNILEAKIKGHKYITNSFLLKMDFGDNVKPASNLSKEELTKLYRAVYYQLNERMSFVGPPDDVVATLLNGLGSIAFLNGNYKYAIKNYTLSTFYGLRGSNNEHKTNLAIHYLQKENPARSTSIETIVMDYPPYIYIGIGVISSLLLYLLLRLLKHIKSRPEAN